MVKGKKGLEATETGIWYLIAFMLLFVIAYIIINWGPIIIQNIRAVLSRISNLFG